ncbi:hypothetical protein QFC20_006296 [Naganishia adeliensis]|uniref:Uncharacterized protein n=1 Tax=Naganishia adeliensis TaxID=92952 RepID=A0ACC2VD18_9TREE|nr:hypothetical protein QFC20_006296 [Naganishia adeliensis]
MSAPPERKPAPVARKSSAAIPPSTFYTGPTVPKKGKSDGPLPVAPTTKESVTGESKMNVDGKNLEQIVKSKGLVPPATLAPNPRSSSLRNPRSHRWLNSTILFILLTSLFSLYACPPPNSTTAQPSFYTKLNPFIATPHLVPAWESIVCKPTNVYRTTVLEPYVVPHVQRRIAKIRGNPIVREYIEPAVVEVQRNDRTMCLYDIRTGKAERRIVMAMRSNSLSWSPTLPTVMLLASEDHNLYTFDIRKLETPTQVYKGHVAGVMSCDWSPTGEEFVSGSYDRTVRLWNRDEGRSRDVYHTKRMQRVFDTVYTPTSDFVLSASDDGNIRIWKNNASAKLGPMDTRERQQMEYRKKLREKWAGEATVRKIDRQRHVPSAIKKTTDLKRTMLDARKAKEENRRRHTREGESKPKAERKKAMVVEQR